MASSPREKALALRYALSLMRNRIAVEAPENAAIVQRHIYALIELVASAPETPWPLGMLEDLDRGHHHAASGPINRARRTALAQSRRATRGDRLEHRLAPICLYTGSGCPLHGQSPASYLETVGYLYAVLGASEGQGNALMIALGDSRLPARFWAKIAVQANGCWLWTAGMERGGYGRIRVAGKGSPNAVAHRFAYERLVGPVPVGLQLDHLCRNRACANPEHVEPVTARTNTLRGDTPAARNAAKTHCLNGHEYNETNTYLVVSRRIRQCRICNKLKMRAFRAARKGTF